MRELYVERLATHDGPESCVGVREGVGEALTGVRIGRAIEPRNQRDRGADAVCPAEGNTVGGVMRESFAGPARSKNHGMRGIFMRENREIPRSPVRGDRAGHSGNVENPARPRARSHWCITIPSTAAPVGSDRGQQTATTPAVPLPLLRSQLTIPSDPAIAQGEEDRAEGVVPSASSHRSTRPECRSFAAARTPDHQRVRNGPRHAFRALSTLRPCGTRPTNRVHLATVRRTARRRTRGVRARPGITSGVLTDVATGQRRRQHHVSHRDPRLRRARRRRVCRPIWGAVETHVHKRMSIAASSANRRKVRRLRTRDDHSLCSRPVRMPRRPPPPDIAGASR